MNEPPTRASSFLSLFVVGHHAAEVSPERDGVVLMAKMHQLVRHHVVEKATAGYAGDCRSPEQVLREAVPSGSRLRKRTP
jgi:hypothetical protein